MTNIGIDNPVTVNITAESWFKAPTLMKLWEIVSYAGRTGIVYRIRQTVDEDVPGITFSIKGWKIYKYAWQNALNLLWLKIKVKFNWI